MIAYYCQKWNNLQLYREFKSLFCHFWQYFASLSCHKWQLYLLYDRSCQNHRKPNLLAPLSLTTPASTLDSTCHFEKHADLLGQTPVSLQAQLTCTVKSHQLQLWAPLTHPTILKRTLTSLVRHQCTHDIASPAYLHHDSHQQLWVPLTHPATLKLNIHRQFPGIHKLHCKPNLLAPWCCTNQKQLLHVSTLRLTFKLRAYTFAHCAYILSWDHSTHALSSLHACTCVRWLVTHKPPSPFSQVHAQSPPGKIPNHCLSAARNSYNIIM